MPPTVLRLFVALRPSEAVRERLAGEVRRVGEAAPRARLVRPENLHLTLAFLGATPEAVVPDLESALRDSVAGLAAFPWRVAGLGAFPTVARARVVWAGVDAARGAPEAGVLAAAVREAVEAAGCPAEADDRFHAHLTLARLDPPGAPPPLEKLLTRGTLQDTYTPEIASDVALMVSEQGGHGLRYRALCAVPLAPGAQGGPTRGAQGPRA